MGGGEGRVDSGEALNRSTSVLEMRRAAPNSQFPVIRLVPVECLNRSALVSVDPRSSVVECKESSTMK